MRSLLAGVLLLLLLAGCSDGSNDATDSPTSAVTSETASSDEPSATSAEPSATSTEPPLPPAITTAGAERVKLSERQPLILGKYPREPDWLAVGFGSVWAQQSTGSVLRFSPAGKLVATIDADIYRSPLCQGIGLSGDAVWACATNGKIIRIDPDTNAVAAIVSAPKISGQGRLVSAAGQLWLLTGDGDELSGVSLADNSLGQPIKLGSYCTDLAVGDDESVWVICSSDGLLLRVDPEAGEITGRVALPNAINAAVAEHVWVVFDGGVAQVDRETLEVLAVYEIFPGLSGGVRASSTAVWIRSEGEPFLTHIDPNTGEVVETITAPGLTSGGDVIEMGDNVWASAYDDKRIVRLNR